MHLLLYKRSRASVALRRENNGTEIERFYCNTRDGARELFNVSN